MMDWWPCRFIKSICFDSFGHGLHLCSRSHFESLAQYQHLPAPLVRALGAAKAVLLHISGAEEPKRAGPMAGESREDRPLTNTQQKKHGKSTSRGYDMTSICHYFTHYSTFYSMMWRAQQCDHLSSILKCQCISSIFCHVYDMVCIVITHSRHIHVRVNIVQQHLTTTYDTYIFMS